MVGGKGNGRGEDVISYGHSQWNVGESNNVLPVFVVSATSLGLPGRPTSLYQIFSCGGVPERPCVPEAYHDYSRTQTSHLYFQS